MKKNLLARLGVLALAFTLVTSSLVAGTYSKYTSQVTGSDTAKVAKFAFSLKAGGTEYGNQSTSGSQTFNLFSYTDSGVYANNTSSTKDLIAPGTTGTMAYELDSTSQVAVKAILNLTQAQDGTGTIKVPIYYTFDTVDAADHTTTGTQRYSDVLNDTGFKTLATMSTDMSAVAASLAPSDGNNAVTMKYVIHWTWDFENGGANQTDSNDTTLGLATPNVTLTINTTVEQNNA